ncbi:mitochondrial carrier domain-containing protein [Catenaria anguillulae PL171]|uniref:Mitochondrial carrier domain-containing protein n=1 Tax=Catenaria anguillulae PL171 TaxID=765915 RepID=A0A1Y2H8C4_9FUNG|nr:mitochondrial carrier domain-containing protein [Catenaria anguillulae PL171]
MTGGSSSDSSPSSALRDIAFGSFAGVCGKIVEFPADTVKVKLQSQPIDGSAKLYNGPVDCFRQTVAREGFRGLYRGLSSPLVGAVLENATLFVSYNHIQKMIRASRVDSTEDGELTLPELFTAGALAGTVASFLLTPIELVKCKLQVQDMARTGEFGAGASTVTAAAPGVKTKAIGKEQRRYYAQPSAPKKGAAAAAFPSPTTSSMFAAAEASTASSGFSRIITAASSALSSSARPTTTTVAAPVAAAGAYSGPIDVIRRTFRTHGLAGFYRGHLGTMLRETGGSAAWFGVYEVAIRQLIQYHQSHSLQGEQRVMSKADLATSELLFAGALAGISYNVVLFPADVIKSRQQTEDELRALRGKDAKLTGSAGSGFWQVGRNLYRAEGIRGLYRGCLVTVVKSTPTSAVIFGVYEMLNRNF